MNKKVVKKKSKLIRIRLFTVIFSMMFIVSLFSGIKALAETNPFSLTNATIEEKSDTVTGSVQSFDNDTVNNDISFHKLNDYVTYKLVIKSNLSNDITILSITDDNENEYIAYEYDKYENEKVTKGSSFNFLVKAIYKNELTDTSKRIQTDNVKFTINYLEDGEVKGDTITINPKTGDGISSSFILFIISSVGLVTCIALDKKRKNKKTSKVSTFVIAGLILSPIVVKATTSSFVISLNNQYVIKDKLVITVNDGSNTNDIVIGYNDIITLPIPEKTGYEFIKWVDEDGNDIDITDSITDDISIEAKFNKKSYSISYNLNGGSLDISNPSTYTIEDSFTLKKPSKSGYEFEGWTGSNGDTPEKTVKIETSTGNLEFKANYVPNTYMIIYNSNGGTGIMSNQDIKYDEDTLLSINTFEKTGYHFTNWSTNSDGSGDTYSDGQLVKSLKEDGSLTLYANYEPNTYEIVFNKNNNDATGTMNNLEMIYDTPKNLPTNKFIRTGYNFNSWNTESDGTGETINNLAEVNNLATNDIVTLYAMWEKKNYTVTIVANNATASSQTLNIAYNSTGSFTLTPNNKYYLVSYSCTNGYTINNLSTGNTATSAQTVTINNNKVDNNSVCTFVYDNKYLLYNVANIGDYIEYKPTTTTYTFSVDDIKGTFDPSATTSWRVLSKNSDGTIDIIPASTAGTLTIGNSRATTNITYVNYSYNLQKIADLYKNTTYASNARAISESDFNKIKANGLTISNEYAINKQEDDVSDSYQFNQQGGNDYNSYIYYASNDNLVKFKIFHIYSGTSGSSSTGYEIDLGIRPIIVIKANIYENGGDGSSSTPWKLTN